MPDHVLHEADVGRRIAVAWWGDGVRGGGHHGHARRRGNGRAREGRRRVRRGAAAGEGEGGEEVQQEGSCRRHLHYWVLSPRRIERSSPPSGNAGGTKNVAARCTAPVR